MAIPGWLDLGVLFFFNRYAVGAKIGPSWWPRTPGTVLPFLLQRRRKDELGLGDEELEPREEPFGASEMA